MLLLISLVYKTCKAYIITKAAIKKRTFNWKVELKRDQIRV